MTKLLFKFALVSSPALLLLPSCSGDDSGDGDSDGDAVEVFVVERVAAGAAQCFESELPVDEDGQLLCQVIEVAPAVVDGGPDLSCIRTGRSTGLQAARDAAVDFLEVEGDCTGDSCESVQACEVNQLFDTEGRNDCLYNEGDPQALATAGFCYIDEDLVDDEGIHTAGGFPEGGGALGGSTNGLVEDCDSGAQRMLRFVGVETPAPGAQALLVCPAGSR